MSADAAVATRVALASTARHLAPHRGLFLRVCVVGLGLLLGSMATTVVSVEVAVRSVRDEPVLGALLLLTLLVVATGLLAWTDSWLSHVLAYRVIDTMRQAVHAALARLAPHGLGRRRSGETAASAMSDAEQLEWFFAHTVAQVVAGSLAAVAATVVAVVHLGAVGLVVPLAQLALLAVPVVGARQAASQGRRLRSDVSTLSADAVELRQAARDLLLLGRLDLSTTTLQADTVAIQRTRRGVALRTGVEQAAVEAIGAATTLAVLVLVARQVSAGRLDVGTLPTATVLAGVALLPVLTVMGSLLRVPEMGAAAVRVDELVSAAPASPPTTTVPTTTAPCPTAPCPTAPCPTAPRPTDDADVRRPATPGTIALRSVSASYPGADHRALDDVDLEVAAGEHVAVVGASGAGKSTLAQLLVRLIEADAGAVVVGGTDVADESVARTRSRVALAPQHPHLFRSSVRDNLLLASPAADDDLLWTVLAQVGLADHVRGLPDGLDTVLTEHGRTWSGGQRQRLGLARAVLRDPEVLVLDEPTANLDQEAERAFLDRVGVLRDGRTTVIVSHRPATIARCPRVVLMVAGRLAADSTHASLLAGDPRYRAVLDTATDDSPSSPRGGETA